MLLDVLKTNINNWASFVYTETKFLLFDTFGLLISGKIEELELNKEKVALGWQGRSHCMLKTIIDLGEFSVDES
jgi:hypothetical protein